MGVGDRVVVVVFVVVVVVVEVVVVVVVFSSVVLLAGGGGGVSVVGVRGMSPIAVDVVSGERKGAFGGRSRSESVQEVVAVVVLCVCGGDGLNAV